MHWFRHQERPSVDKEHEDMLLLPVVFLFQIYNLSLIVRKYQMNANWGAYKENI